MCGECGQERPLPQLDRIYPTESQWNICCINQKSIFMVYFLFAHTQRARWCRCRSCMCTVRSRKWKRQTHSYTHWKRTNWEITTKMKTISCWNRPTSKSNRCVQVCKYNRKLHHFGAKDDSMKSHFISQQIEPSNLCLQIASFAWNVINSEC